MLLSPPPTTAASPLPLRPSAPPPSLHLRSPSLSITLKSLTTTAAARPLVVRCRRSSDYFGGGGGNQHRGAARPPTLPAEVSSPPPSLGVQSSRVYVGYSIYKGKAALTVDPKAPEFVPLESGAYKISKEGCILLQFAPAVGTRQYDWNRKQVFSLSVTEIGQLMCLGARDSCEFFHDPFKGRSEEGKIRKVLKAEPLPDGTGHFFNLSVQNRLLNVDESIYIPITKAEFTILNSSFNFIIPYLVGWHAFANAIRPEDSFQTNNFRSGAELEWSR